MKKNTEYKNLVLITGTILGAFFLISCLKCVSYSVVLANQSFWNEFTIYRMLGVEAAYVYSNCRDNFVSTLIFRLVGWCLCAGVSGVLFVFRWIVPAVASLISKLRKENARGE